MVTLTIPDEIVIALALLPGYLAIRVGLYFARKVAPDSWSEFEKTAWSLVGSIVLIGGTGLVVPQLVRLDQGDQGIAIVTQISVNDYIFTLVLAIGLGAILGRSSAVVYQRIYGLTPRREHPIDYLIRRAKTPIPVRVITDNQVITGRARYSNADSNLVVLSKPRRVTQESGKEHRQRMGEFVYVDPDSIKHIYFGSEFEPEKKWWRIFERFTPDSNSSKQTASPSEEPSESAGTEVVTLSKDPLKRKDACVRAGGTLKNTTAFTLGYLQVDITFKNHENAVIGAGFDSTTGCDPGEVWRFDVPFETDDPETIEGFDVNWYADYY